jgi:hypothetical protein
MGVRWYLPRAARWLSADIIVPDPGNPQSLNRFAYVLGNPLKYIDPSGHIEEGEYERALWIVEWLARHGVYIDVDFGWRENPTMSPAPGERVAPIVGWDPGLWEYSDLEVVKAAVATYRREAGSVDATRMALAGVTIRRVSAGKTAYYEGLSLITLADYTFQQPGPRAVWGPQIAVAHELAHHWDWKAGGANSTGISGGILMELGPTDYGRMGGPKEEWAESVAGYLYPVYFQILGIEGSPDENFTVVYHFGFAHKLPGLGVFHSAFVASRFNSLRVK